MASRKVVARWLESGQPGFAAHVGFYPGCKWLKRHFCVTGPGAPILNAKNNTAILKWDAEAAHDSRKRAVAFLRQAFDL